ncbi:MAG TPA: TMEM165/GDT1 family protein [Marmoricola sp.]|nr:TMEM165/GDT1 family protein [Marmoricola sp.]HNO39046.1 TMEM165/GDT1 family protein [Marmoricola sp.]
MDFGLMAMVFGAIFIVELPDKTFIAALVLSTRYRPLAVWVGVGLAFLVQTLIAVTAGGLLSLLPKTPVHLVAMVIFLVGAVLLFRAAPTADQHRIAQEEEYAAQSAVTRTGWSAVLASFLVLFVAEWGDLSQLLTASLVAKHGHPVSVFLGAWLALLSVSGLAVIAGRTLLRHLRLSVVHYAGGCVCLLLAALTAYTLL